MGLEDKLMNWGAIGALLGILAAGMILFITIGCALQVCILVIGAFGRLIGL